MYLYNNKKPNWVTKKKRFNKKLRDLWTDFDLDLANFKMFPSSSIEEGKSIPIYLQILARNLK